MKHTEPQSISEIIDRIREKGIYARKLAERTAIESFGRIVGTSIDKAVKRKEIEGDTLLLHVDSASLRQEISMHRSTIIREINTLTGKNIISQIKFI